MYGNYHKEMISLIAPDTLTATQRPWYGGPFIDGFHTGLNIDASYQHNAKSLFLLGLSVLDDQIRPTKFFSNHISHNGLHITPEDGMAISSIRLFEGVEDVQLNQNNQMQYGAYMQYRWVASDKLSLFAGIRADIYHQFTSTANPRLGLIYKPKPNMAFKLLAGSAFRAPSIAERFVQEFEITGNPELSPEHIKTFELVYLHQIGNWQINTTLFHNTTSDKITFDDDIESWENIEESLSSFGFETEIGGTIGKKLSAKLTYAYFFGDLSDGLFQHFGTLNLNYRHKKFQFNINTIFRGNETLGFEEEEEEEEDGEFSTNYFLFNSRIAYKVHPKVNLFLLTKNLGNFRFSTYSEELQEKAGFLMLSEGREIRLGVEIDLNF